MTEVSVMKLTTRILLVGSLLLLVGSLPAAELPDSPAGKQLEQWLELARSGDTERAREHYHATFTDTFRNRVSEEGYLAVFAQTGALLGKRPVESVEVRSEHALSAYAQSSQLGWIEIRIKVEAEAPHKIALIVTRPGAPPEAKENEASQ
jgi:hypothetical protein